jgi:5-methylcytosine-specific restriction enzyme A
MSFRASDHHSLEDLDLENLVEHWGLLPPSQVAPILGASTSDRYQLRLNMVAVVTAHIRETSGVWVVSNSHLMVGKRSGGIASAMLNGCGRAHLVERQPSDRAPHRGVDEALHCAFGEVPALIESYRRALLWRTERRRDNDRLRRQRRAGRAGPGSERLRRQVLAEEPTCRACRAPATEVDHIVPLNRRGSGGRANLQALCKPCHKAKSDLEQSLAKLATIARRLEVTEPTAKRWAATPDFPVSVAAAGFDGTRWDWRHVEVWALEHRKLPPLRLGVLRQRQGLAQRATTDGAEK